MYILLYLRFYFRTTSQVVPAWYQHFVRHILEESSSVRVSAYILLYLEFYFFPTFNVISAWVCVLYSGLVYVVLAGDYIEFVLVSC